MFFFADSNLTWDTDVCVHFLKFSYENKGPKRNEEFCNT